MYLFFSFLLTFTFTLLAVAGETERGRTHPRALFLANLVFTAAGLLLTAAAFFLARGEIYGGGFDAEFSGWAWDMLAAYYRISLPPFVLFLAVSTLSCLIAVFDRKQRSGFPLKLRLTVTVVFSVVMLLLAPAYSFMAANDKIALDTYIFLTGFGEALVLRAPLLIEYGRRIREERAAQVTGK